MTAAIAAGVVLAALILTPIARGAALRLDVIDVPNERSSHRAPVPRAGGVAVALAATGGVVASEVGGSLSVALIAGALVLGGIGLVDDRRQLRAALRLAAQAVVAASVVVVALRTADTGALIGALAAIGAFVWIVGYVNAFNFMDGINGISAAQAIVGGAALAVLGARNDVDVLTVGGTVIAAAFVGFVPFNAPIAYVFLGDVGSYFTGCWLATLVVVAWASDLPVEVAVAPFLYYALDTSTTLVSRARRGHRIGEAHRDHAYQRLARTWGSHVAVSLAVAAVCAIDGFIMLAVSERSAITRAVALAVAATIAGALVAYGRASEPDAA